MGINFARIIYRTHAFERMFERGISISDVRHVLVTGDVIMNYPDDRPYPSCLLLGWRGERPLHVVVAINRNENEAIVITAYEPEQALWESGFRRKK